MLRIRVSVLLLLIAPTGNAIISEAVNGYTFTAPDPPDSTLSTKEGAEQWCLRNNSTLAEIYNLQIQQAIVSFINGKSQTGLGRRSIWINGMRTPLSSWMWVNGKNAARFSSLPQTDNEKVNGYLQNNQNGRSISADLPTVTRGYICEGVDSLCIGGFQYNSRCYRAFSTPALSWYDARNECKNSDGDIASFDFINDGQSLKSFNWSWIDSFNPYWIGIRSRWWTWQNSNSEIIYTNWLSGQPTAAADCIQMMAGAQWYWGTYACNEPQQLICLRDTTLTSASTSPKTISQMPPTSTHSTLQSSLRPTTTPQSSSPTENVSHLDYNSSIKTSTSASTTLRTTNQMPPSSTHSMLQSPLQSTTTSQFSTLTENASPKDSNNSIQVPLGVGLGVGIGGLLIVIVVILLIKRHRQKKSESQSNDTSVSFSAYDSIQYETTRSDISNSAPTYQELNINRPNHSVTSVSSSAYDSIIYGATRRDINNSAPTFQELNINRPNHSVTSVSSAAYDSIIYGPTRRDINSSAPTFQELIINSPYRTVIP